MTTIYLSAQNDVISIIEDSKNKKFEDKISQNITTEAEKIALVKKIKPLILIARDKSHKKVGGLTAYRYYGSLQIDVLWVEPEYRKKGIGKALLKRAEQIAINENINMITLSTMEWWNSVDFYKAQGFVVEFTRDGFYKNYKQIHLKKMIIHENEKH